MKDKRRLLEAALVNSRGTMQTQRGLTFLALLGVCALALAACGGGGSSSKKGPATSASAGAAGTSGASGAAGAGTTAATGASGTSGRARGHRKTGGTKAPSQPRQSGGSGGVSQTPSQPSSGSKDSGTKKGKKGRKGGGGNAQSGPPSNYTGQQKELYREAKIVCGALTLDGLAKEYVVKKTPEAVARAYSASYEPNLRGAAYLGCKAAFAKR